MKLSSRFHRTAEDVSSASQSVVSTTQYASVALVAVAAVALLALGIAVVALSETRHG